MNWYDDLTDEQIEWLKSNRVPCNLLTTDEYLMLKRVPPADREYFDNKGCAWCGSAMDQITSYWHRVHRLCPDWQRPEEKQGEWEYWDVIWFSDEGEWKIQQPGSYWLEMLSGALNRNFGGIEYEEWPGRWYPLGIMKYKPYDTADWEADLYQPHRIIAIPATPKRVRFWRGK